MEKPTVEIDCSGYGAGYGYGYGYGDGYGYGYGYGDGSGYGSGYGAGYGYGYGAGYGYGYGYGDGYGYGYGAGSGYGYGYGDGSGYLKALLESRSANYRGSIVAFWRCTSDNTPANGGVGTKARHGLIEEINGPLKICTKNALHATTDPSKWKGSHWWIVALHGETQKQEDKIGALKREFVECLGKCPF